MLTVEGLRVRFPSPIGVVEAVRGVSFTVGREKLGIVGESGSGKTVTGRAIMGLVPGLVEARRLDFAEIDILGASERQMRGVRGRRITMIMQDPRYALNPVMPVGEQIAEVVRLHAQASAVSARTRTLEMLEAVRIRDCERVYRAYPHQLSGGMGQRVMIAMMLSAEPDLLIADEPTSALDVTVRLKILAILDDLVSQRGMGLIFISHDLNLVASFCDRVLIMRSGRVVDRCGAADLRRSSHPYTRGLLAALPRMDRERETLPVLDRTSALDSFGDHD